MVRFKNYSNLKGFLLRYGSSLVIFGVATFLTKALWPFIRPSPVPLFFASIMAAFWGGFGPGLFVSIISALTIDFFFVLPYGHFEWTSQNLVRMGVFITVSSLISRLNSTRKRLMDERGKLLTQIEGFNDELRNEIQAATRELVRTNDALFSTQQQLAKSEQLAIVGMITGSLAHEIGTPLNAISGHLELLERYQSNDTNAERRISIIRQQLDFIVGRVKLLLERTHERTMQFERVNLEGLVREVLWLVGPTLESHGIVAQLVAPDSTITVEADHQSLQRVLLNLCNNSMDAMPNGGRIEITVRCDQANEVNEILFTDSGPGINDETAASLFEPLWTTKPLGNGFGLAIAREVMGKHGGHISVVNPGQLGAMFRLTLPVIRSASAVKLRKDFAAYVA